MPAILPFLTLIAILFILRQRFKSFDLRLVILLAAACWGVLLVAITEILSLFHLFNRPALIIAWGLATIVTGVWALMKWQKIRFLPFHLQKLQWFQLVCILGIAALTAVIAVIAAPNNWDSMVYHLSRVAHWIQNGSVDHYPTSVLRQLYNPVFAEYEIAHLQILSGGDYLAQIPQWLSMLGCVIGISLITKRLGGNTQAQIFSSFFTATIPMGILQATTTQNDYVTAFWLVCLVALILETDHHSERILPVAMGVCLGLAVLTKMSAYMYALPFILYYGVRGLKRYRLRFLPVVLVIGLLALVINIPLFSRNYALFHSPFGPAEEMSRHQNEVYSLKGTTANVIRNAGLYAGSIEPINNVLDNAVERIFGGMNLDVNDPRFTMSGHVFKITTPQFHEDTMGSSLHLVIALVSLIILIMQRKKIGSNTFISYSILVLLGFLIFCVLLRWQTWHVRLHLPLLVLCGAWVGLLAQISKKWVIWALSLLMAVMVLPVFYFNPNKPLVADYNIFNLPRREVMIMRKSLVVPYIESVNYLIEEDCYQTGLYTPNQEWEYPFWSLYADTGKPFRLEHVNVDNVSANIPLEPFSPCAIIATQSTGEQFQLENGAVYNLSWSMDPVYVYTK